MKKVNIKNEIIDYLCYIIGCVMYGVSVVVFTAPNNIAPGGATGIGTIVNYLTGFPIGITIIIVNIPLFLFGVKKFGIKPIAKTIVVTLLSGVIIDLLNLVLPEYKGDMFLVCIYAGVLSGAGLSLILIRGATTGGTELAAKLILTKFPHMQMGRMLMLVDAIVIIASMIVFRNIESGLYAVILVTVSSFVIDKVLYGLNKGKVMLVISDKETEIADEIFNKVDRGVTYLNAEGGYTKKAKRMLMVAVTNREAFAVMQIIKEIDETAFIVITEAGEVIGEGFKGIHQDNI